jgi:hypothetical protein
MKYNRACGSKAVSGVKNSAKPQAVSAVIERDTRDPVIALDVTRPRRIRTCAEAKNKAARNAK